MKTLVCRQFRPGEGHLGDCETSFPALVAAQGKFEVRGVGGGLGSGVIVAMCGNVID